MASYHVLHDEERACVGKVLQIPVRLLQHSASEAPSTEQTRRRKIRRPVPTNEPISFTEFCNNECSYMYLLWLMIDNCQVLNCRMSVIITQ